jgi:hypothetical protein
MHCSIRYAKLSIDCKVFVGNLPLTDTAIDAANRGDMRPALKEGLGAADQWLSCPSTPKRDADRLVIVCRQIIADLEELDGPIPVEIANMSVDDLMRELSM